MSPHRRNLFFNGTLLFDPEIASKIVLPVSRVYEDRKCELLVKLIRAPSSNPERHITIDEDLQMVDVGVRRVGRPRTNWHEKTIEEYWRRVGQRFDSSVRYLALDLSHQAHIAFIKQEARDYLT